MLIFIPVKDRAVLLPRAIESVLSQTSNCWHLWVMVDEKSTDATEEVARGYCGEKVEIFKSRKGQGEIYKDVMARSKDRFNVIGFLDSDDVLKPEAVEVVLPLFDEDPYLGFVWSQHMFMPSGKEGKSRPCPPPSFAGAVVSNFRRFGPWRVWRRQPWVKSPLRYSSKKCNIVPDVMLQACLSVSGWNHKFIPDVLYEYWQDAEDQLSVCRSHRCGIESDIVRGRLRRFLRKRNRVEVE